MTSYETTSNPEYASPEQIRAFLDSVQLAFEQHVGYTNGPISDDSDKSPYIDYAQRRPLPEVNVIIPKERLDAVSPSIAQILRVSTQVDLTYMPPHYRRNDTLAPQNTWSEAMARFSIPRPMLSSARMAIIQCNAVGDSATAVRSELAPAPNDSFDDLLSREFSGDSQLAEQQPWLASEEARLLLPRSELTALQQIVDNLDQLV